MIEIWPAHAHIHLHDAVRAGKLLIVTVGEPGVHGATVLGMHGIGVKTPNAAAVAEATCGLARELHIPNVGMLVMGAKSLIVAAGVVAVTVGADDALNAAGAAPKVQAIMAPVTTSCPI